MITDGISTEDVVISNIVCELILDSLTDREKNILLRRCYQKETFSAIAKDFDISDKRVSQIYEHVLRKIRKQLVYRYGYSWRNFNLDKDTKKQKKGR